MPHAITPTLRKASSIAAALAIASLPITTAQGDAPAATVTMTEDAKFQPNSVTIKVGQTVEWKNVSSRTHTVTDDPARVMDPAHVQAPPGAQPFDSGRIAPGKTFSHTFTTPGLYKYVCAPHERNGMAGSVDVR